MFDTPVRFGLITILLHWISAICMIGLFVLGWYMVTLTYYDSLYNTLPSIHKSIGILFGFLLLPRFAWKLVNVAPAPLKSHGYLEIVGARLAHWTLHITAVVIVLSGYLISTASGSGIEVFNWFTLPASITTITQQEDVAGLIHKYVAYGMIIVALIHGAAALMHHFVNRDDTLRRMLGLDR